VEQLVSSETLESVNELFDTIYLFDRLTDSIHPEKKLTYRQYFAQLAVEEGISVILKDPVCEHTFPIIDKEQKTLKPRFVVADEPGNRKEQAAPGGHGLNGFWTMMRLLNDDSISVTTVDKPTIAALYNEDGINNMPDEVVTGWMARKRVPMVMVTTTKASLDMKGGQIGIQKLPNGKVKKAMLEIKQAANNGQEDLFKKIGLIEGEQRAQYFNTNMALFNYSVLQPFIRDLVAYIGIEKFQETIAPALIQEDTKDKKSYSLGGALGMVILNFASFVETSDDEQITALAVKHGLVNETGKVTMLRIVNADESHRTRFFTPIKNAFDYWIQYHSDFYKVNTEVWQLEQKGKRIPGVDLQDPWYKEVLNVMEAFEDTSVIGLEELIVTGIAKLPRMVLQGSIHIDVKGKDSKLAPKDGGMAIFKMLDRWSPGAVGVNSYESLAFGAVVVIMRHKFTRIFWTAYDWIITGSGASGASTVADDRPKPLGNNRVLAGGGGVRDYKPEERLFTGVIEKDEVFSFDAAALIESLKDRVEKAAPMHKSATDLIFADVLVRIENDKVDNSRLQELLQETENGTSRRFPGQEKSIAFIYSHTRQILDENRIDENRTFEDQEISRLVLLLNSSRKLIEDLLPDQTGPPQKIKVAIVDNLGVNACKEITKDNVYIVFDHALIRDIILGNYDPAAIQCILASCLCHELSHTNIMHSWIRELFEEYSILTTRDIPALERFSNARSARFGNAKLFWTLMKSYRPVIKPLVPENGVTAGSKLAIGSAALILTAVFYAPLKLLEYLKVLPDMNPYVPALYPYLAFSLLVNYWVLGKRGGMKPHGFLFLLGQKTLSLLKPVVPLFLAGSAWHYVTLALRSYSAGETGIFTEINVIIGVASVLLLADWVNDFLKERKEPSHGGIKYSPYLTNKDGGMETLQSPIEVFESARQAILSDPGQWPYVAPEGIDLLREANLDIVDELNGLCSARYGEGETHRYVIYFLESYLEELIRQLGMEGFEAVLFHEIKHVVHFDFKHKMDILGRLFAQEYAAPRVKEAEAEWQALEFDADIFSALGLMRQGHDPMAAVRSLEWQATIRAKKFEGYYRDNSKIEKQLEKICFETHPSEQERIARIKDSLAQDSRDGGNKAEKHEEDHVSVTSSQTIRILAGHVLTVALPKLDYDEVFKLYQSIRETLYAERNIYYTASGRSGTAITIMAELLEPWWQDYVKTHGLLPPGKHHKKSIYREQATQWTPQVMEGAVVMAASGSGETSSVNEKLESCVDCGAEYMAITATPGAAIWQKLKEHEKALIVVPGQTKKSQAMTYKEKEKQDRFKKAAPMGTSFELALGLLGMGLVEAMMHDAATKEEVKYWVEDYIRSVLSLAYSDIYKRSIPAPKIKHVVEMIESIWVPQQEFWDAYKKAPKRTKRPQIVIVADGISYRIALLFSTRLNQLNIHAEVYQADSAMTAVTERDLVVFIGVTTNEKRFEKLVELKSLVGNKLVAISALYDKETAQKADVAFALNGTTKEAAGQDYITFVTRGVKPLLPSQVKFWPLSWILTEIIISQLGGGELLHAQDKIEADGGIEEELETIASSPFDKAPLANRVAVCEQLVSEWENRLNKGELFQDDVTRMQVITTDLVSLTPLETDLNTVDASVLV
ncbi:MAG: UTP--glucose-1-phosphate uridylyltransferase, partial [Candidatus Omnitrophota bacterium]